MAKYNKLKAILLPPMIYQFCQGLTAIHRYGKLHRILIDRNRCSVYLLKRASIGFIISDIIRRKILTSKRLFFHVYYIFILLKYLFCYFFLSEPFI